MTLQELRMLSIVTLNCHEFRFSRYEMLTISHSSQVMSWSLSLSVVFDQVMSHHHSDKMSQRSQVSMIVL